MIGMWCQEWKGSYKDLCTDDLQAWKNQTFDPDVIGCDVIGCDGISWEKKCCLSAGHLWTQASSL